MELYKHPRVVELRLIQIYDKIKLINPNEVKALEGIMMLIDFLEVNNGHELRDVFQLDYKVKKFQYGTEYEMLRYRRQHILTASLYGVTKRELAKYILPLSEGTLYRANYQLEKFYDEQFEKELDETIEVIHSERLRDIGLEFISKFHIMEERLNVSTSST